MCNAMIAAAAGVHVHLSTFWYIDKWMKHGMVEDDRLKILSIDEFEACSYEWLEGV